MCERKRMNFIWYSLDRKSICPRPICIFSQGDELILAFLSINITKPLIHADNHTNHMALLMRITPTNDNVDSNFQCSFLNCNSSMRFLLVPHHPAIECVFPGSRASCVSDKWHVVSVTGVYALLVISPHQESVRLYVGFWSECWIYLICSMFYCKIYLRRSHNMMM